ncbi:hypothetical protein ABPG75_003455 [Micractinium tetrahymenae]
MAPPQQAVPGTPRGAPSSAQGAGRDAPSGGSGLRQPSPGPQQHTPAAPISPIIAAAREGFLHSDQVHELLTHPEQHGLTMTTAITKPPAVGDLILCELRRGLHKNDMHLWMKGSNSVLKVNGQEAVKVFYNFTPDSSIQRHDYRLLATGSTGGPLQLLHHHRATHKRKAEGEPSSSSPSRKQPCVRGGSCSPTAPMAAAAAAAGCFGELEETEPAAQQQPVEQALPQESGLDFQQAESCFGHLLASAKKAKAAEERRQELQQQLAAAEEALAKEAHRRQRMKQAAQAARAQLTAVEKVQAEERELRQQAEQAQQAAEAAQAEAEQRVKQAEQAQQEMAAQVAAADKARAEAEQRVEQAERARHKMADQLAAAELARAEAEQRRQLAGQAQQEATAFVMRWMGTIEQQQL